jgi:hypothetical protein
MTTSNEEAALRQAAPQATLFSDDSNTPACQHKRTTLLRFDCGAGGIQYRRASLECWHLSVQSPMHKHALSYAERKRRAETLSW